MGMEDSGRPAGPVAGRVVGRVSGPVVAAAKGSSGGRGATGAGADGSPMRAPGAAGPVGSAGPRRTPPATAAATVDEAAKLHRARRRFTAAFPTRVTQSVGRGAAQTNTAALLID